MVYLVVYLVPPKVASPRELRAGVAAVTTFLEIRNMVALPTPPVPPLPLLLSPPLPLLPLLSFSLCRLVWVLCVCVSRLCMLTLVGNMEWCGVAGIGMGGGSNPSNDSDVPTESSENHRCVFMSIFDIVFLSMSSVSVCTPSPLSPCVLLLNTFLCAGGCLG